MGKSPSISNLTVKLTDGDLFITYDLPPTTDEQYFIVRLTEATIDGQALLIAPEYLNGDVNKQIPGGAAKSIRWMNLYDQYIELQGELILSITVDLWGDFKKFYGVDCAAGRPDFTARQRLPHYLAAGLGAASIGLGQIFRSQRDDVRDNNYLASETRAEAEPFYQDANSKHHTYLILTYTGASILAADVIWYVLRSSGVKKRQKLYDQHCGDLSFKVKPVFELPTQNTPNGLASIKFSLSF